MRRLLSLFALLLFGLSSAAWADVTVRYKVEGGGPTLSIAAAADGRLRLQAFGPDGRSMGGLITRDGVGYLIAKDGQGLFVVRQDELIAAITQMMSAPGGRQGMAAMQGVFGGQYQVSEGGQATVAGRQGIAYRIAAAGASAGTPPMEIVISTDPDIAPAGREMARLLQLSIGLMNGALGTTPDMIAKVSEVLARGTPLRAGPLALDSVSAAPIPASAFDLPAPVLSREALAARMAGPNPGTPQPAVDADIDTDTDSDTDSDAHADHDAPQPQPR